MKKNRAIFVDRDGTINVDVHYLDDPSRFKMYPRVCESIKRLKLNGFKIIVVTNQSGIGRGYFTETQLSAIHERMKTEFRKVGVELDGIYYCPHRPEDNCNCRKPNTGLFEKAMREHDVDAKKSYVLGDKILDVEAGKRIGAKTILIPEPHERDALLSGKNRWKYTPDYIAEDFGDAANWIISTSSKT